MPCRREPGKGSLAVRVPACRGPAGSGSSCWRLRGRGLPSSASIGAPLAVRDRKLTTYASIYGVGGLRGRVTHHRREGILGSHASVAGRHKNRPFQLCFTIKTESFGHLEPVGPLDLLLNVTVRSSPRGKFPARLPSSTSAATRPAHLVAGAPSWARLGCKHPSSHSTVILRPVTQRPA